MTTQERWYRLAAVGFGLATVVVAAMAVMETNRRLVLARRPQGLLVEGLDRAPEALNMLFTGENLGKLVVAVAPWRAG